MREKRAYIVFVRIPEGKGLLGRPIHRWKDGIKIDLRDVGCEVMQWVRLAQNRGKCQAVVNTVINILKTKTPWP
jgi:hypothetical protein